jgi:hypothetical protein
LGHHGWRAHRLKGTAPANGAFRPTAIGGPLLTSGFFFPLLCGFDFGGFLFDQLM